MKKFQLLFLCIHYGNGCIVFFNAVLTMTISKADPETPPEPKNYHFDIWIALDKHGGMGRDVQTLVKSIDSLTAGSTPIDFKGRWH